MLVKIKNHLLETTCITLVSLDHNLNFLSDREEYTVKVYMNDGNIVSIPCMDEKETNLILKVFQIFSLLDETEIKLLIRKAYDMTVDELIPFTKEFIDNFISVMGYVNCGELIKDDYMINKADEIIKMRKG